MENGIVWESAQEAEAGGKPDCLTFQDNRVLPAPPPTLIKGEGEANWEASRSLSDFKSNDHLGTVSRNLLLFCSMYRAGSLAASYGNTQRVSQQDIECTCRIESKAECVNHAREGSWADAGDLGS